MMARITFWEPSGETEIPGKGLARDHYASGAFSRVIGQRVPFRALPGGPQIGWVTVIDVVVDADGLGAIWTTDVNLDSEGPRPGPQPSMSFGFRVDDLPEGPVRDPLALVPPVIRWRDAR